MSGSGCWAGRREEEKGETLGQPPSAVLWEHPREEALLAELWLLAGVLGGLGGAQGQTSRCSLLLGPRIGPSLCLLPGTWAQA